MSWGVTPPRRRLTLMLLEYTGERSIKLIEDDGDQEAR
jgi:hypothetical protein